MLRRAGQTIGLKFFVDTHGLPGALEAKKSKIFFPNLLNNIFFRIFFSTDNAELLSSALLVLELVLHIYTLT